MPPSVSVTVGKRLQRFREERELSVQEVASVLGLNRGTVYAAEKGTIFPSQQTMQDYCRIYRKEPIDLFIDPDKNLRHQLYEAIRRTPDDRLSTVVEAFAVVEALDKARSAGAAVLASSEPEHVAAARVARRRSSSAK